MAAPEILTALAGVVGEDNLLADDSARNHYGTDWTRFYEPDPMAVVFARDSDQLVRLVLFATEHQLALVPSGGRTGLSAGAVAANGEVVVSFEKMNRILDFNAVDGTVTVEAGVVTQALQQFAEQKNLYYPVDFASSGSSQIGGNIATNAGGIKVLRYGLTRNQVVGLKVVTGTGACLELNQGLVKNATGYDLRHLFIGSEGTLGFVTEATIKLAKAPGELSVVLLGTSSMTDLMRILAIFQKHLSLTAYEFFSDLALQQVLSHHELRPPLERETAFYALIEFEQQDEVTMQRAIAAYEECIAAGVATDGVISQSEQQRISLWQYREFISESISDRTPYKNDESVRVSRVPAFLAEVEETVRLRYPDFEIVWFGHIGDGNLHLNILKPGQLDTAAFKSECEKVSVGILEIV
ncbi:MAG: FAD-binding oxidoreductase, partial [Pseudomonadales bacterium]